MKTRPITCSRSLSVLALTLLGVMLVDSAWADDSNAKEAVVVNPARGEERNAKRSALQPVRDILDLGEEAVELLKDAKDLGSKIHEQVAQVKQRTHSDTPADADTLDHSKCQTSDKDAKVHDEESDPATQTTSLSGVNSESTIGNQ